jgi:hypothetical protein
MRKANATFVILARNGDIKGVAHSIKQIEDRFNRHYHYPYVFLNEQPFSEEFKRCVDVEAPSSSANPHLADGPRILSRLRQNMG